MKLRTIAYNLSIVAGVALIGIGAGLQFGLAIGLITTGACILGLTLLMIRGARGA
ncbi:MAG TPA: hypothetical protein VGF89_00990 [Steroidobacteraceae bacterium]